MNDDDKAEAQQLLPLLMLPSGVAVRPDKIRVIARKEINEFVLFVEGSGAAPHVTGKDLDVLIEFGVVQVAKPTEKDAPKIAPAQA